MNLVSTFASAPTLGPREASAAKRPALSPRVLSRGASEMSGGKKTKLGGNQVDLGVAFLRERHPVKTADCVAADLGISPHTVSKWLSGDSAPGWGHTLALIGAYGPEFLAAVCPRSRVWIEPARKLEERRKLELQRVQLEKRIKALGGDDEIAGMDQSAETRDGGPGLLAGGMVDGVRGLDRLGSLADESGET